MSLPLGNFLRRKRYPLGKLWVQFLRRVSFLFRQESYQRSRLGRVWVDCSRNQSHLPRPLQARTIVGAVYISPPKKVVYLGDRTAPMDRAKRRAFSSENRSTHDFLCLNPSTHPVIARQAPLAVAISCRLVPASVIIPCHWFAMTRGWEHGDWLHGYWAADKGKAGTSKEQAPRIKRVCPMLTPHKEVIWKYIEIQLYGRYKGGKTA